MIHLLRFDVSESCQPVTVGCPSFKFVIFRPSILFFIKIAQEVGCVLSIGPKSQFVPVRVKVVLHLVKVFGYFVLFFCFKHFVLEFSCQCSVADCAWCWRHCQASLTATAPPTETEWFSPIATVSWCFPNTLESKITLSFSGIRLVNGWGLRSSLQGRTWGETQGESQGWKSSTVPRSHPLWWTLGRATNHEILSLLSQKWNVPIERVWMGVHSALSPASTTQPGPHCFPSFPLCNVAPYRL